MRHESGWTCHGPRRSRRGAGGTGRYAPPAPRWKPSVRPAAPAIPAARDPPGDPPGVAGGSWPGPHRPPVPGPMDEPLDPAETPRPDTPWIETRAGGLFFVNVLLVTPVAVVLLPLALGALLRSVGALEGPSRMFDTIPMVAAYFLPRVGWLAAPAAWFTWKSFGETGRSGARWALALFLVVHLVTLALTVRSWVT